MKFELENLKEDFSRDTYWTKIHIKSDDEVENTTVLVCASYEYLSDLFKAKNKSEIKFNLWIEDVLNKWKSYGENVFKLSVRYDIYTKTKDGEKNAQEFLTSLIS